MSAPRVTVLLPVHNGERFVGQAVESILGQTYRDFELVVVDDHSTDGTADVLASYADPRLHVVANTAEQGFDATLNLGIRIARGELLARMDADDVSLPKRLEQQVAFLDAHPHMGVLGTNYQPMDEHGADRGRPARQLPTLPGHVHWRLLSYNCVNHPTVMMRTAVLRNLGGYDCRTFPADDYDLWLRAARVTQVANLPDVLLRYRVHGDSISSTRRQEAATQELEVVRRAQACLLGRPVSEPATRVLRDPWAVTVVDREDALEAAANVRGLADACLMAPRLSSPERRVIAVGAGRRLLRLIGRAAPSRPALAAAMAASSLTGLLRYAGIALLNSRSWRPPDE